MITRLGSISLLIILIISCSNERVVLERDNYKIIYNTSTKEYTGYRYYSESSVESEEELNKEYQINGQANSFYENGNLRLQETFKNGIKEGSEIGYYPSGNKQYKGQNYSGQKDSVWYWYVDNLVEEGRLLAVENYSNGNLFGSQVRFDSFSSKPIIKFYSFDGLLGILRSDESDSDHEVVEGELVYCMYNKNELQVGETFDLSVFIAHRESANVEVNLKLRGTDVIEDQIIPSLQKVHPYMSIAQWTYELRENEELNLEIEIIMLENRDVLYRKKMNLPLAIN